MVFESLRPEDWLWALTGVLTFPPSLVSIRNYYKVKTSDYLALFGIFFVTFINTAFNFTRTLLEIDMGSPLTYNIINSLFYLAIFFIFIHALLLRWSWKKKPAIIWFGGITWFVFVFIDRLFLFTGATFIDTVITNNAVESFPLLGTIRLVVDSISSYGIIVITGILMVYAYLTFTPARLTKRTRMVRRLFMIGSTVMVLWGIVSMIFYLLTWWSLVSMASFITQMIAWSLLAYAAIRYPEAMLISKVQLLRAEVLYQRAKNMDLQDEMMNPDRIMDYLKDIPPEIFQRTMES
ncbi:MAG: hypothetical protein ACFFD4_32065 [Candidatus Odinarchaeota archaeon]